MKLPLSPLAQGTTTCHKLTSDSASRSAQASPVLGITLSSKQHLSQLQIINHQERFVVEQDDKTPVSFPRHGLTHACGHLLPLRVGSF